MIFSFEGHTVIPCQDMSLAFEKAIECNPDCILIDMSIEDSKSSFSLAQKLKTDSRTAKIPLIFVTKSKDQHDQTHAFVAGAIDLITKPFKLNEILERTRPAIDLGRLQKIVSKVIDKLN